MKFREKTPEIEAFRIGVDAIPDWFMDKVTSREAILLSPTSLTNNGPFDHKNDTYCIITYSDGEKIIKHGEYVIKNVFDEISSLDIKTFNKKYDEVEKFESIDVVLWTGKNEREMFDFLTGTKNKPITTEESTFKIDLVNGGCKQGNLIIKTPFGVESAFIGDYIIKDKFLSFNNTVIFHPVRPDIFDKNYKEVKCFERLE